MWEVDLIHDGIKISLDVESFCGFITAELHQNKKSELKKT